MLQPGDDFAEVFGFGDGELASEVFAEIGGGDVGRGGEVFDNGMARGEEFAGFRIGDAED